MKRPWIICCLLAGCTFGAPPAVDPTGDAAMTDGMPGDTMAAGPCHGTRPFSRVCLASEPTAPLLLSGMIDTASADCLPTVGSATGSCVLAGTSVTINAITVIGPRPLIVVATTSLLEVVGDIDASSHIGGMAGAGAEIGPCNAGTPPGSRGGGQGGSFGGSGGNGGDSSQGGARGTAGGPVALGNVLRGGCAGTAGQGTTGGPGGAGGGAIALVSKLSIRVAATINASGAGGGRGEEGGGGAGGGGSGGTIVLDTPDLQLSGRLFANGGGGGGGGDGDSTGNPGNDPTPPDAGAGGDRGDEGGAGGDGSLGAAGSNGTNGSGGNGGGGGGGGGGGAGVIVTTDPTPPTQDVSPPSIR